MQTHEWPDKNPSPFLPHGLITLHNATAGSLTHTRCAGNMKDRRKGVVEIRGERKGGSCIFSSRTPGCRRLNLLDLRAQREHENLSDFPHLPGEGKGSSDWGLWEVRSLLSEWQERDGSCLSRKAKP